MLVKLIDFAQDGLLNLKIKIVNSQMKKEKGPSIWCARGLYIKAKPSAPFVVIPIQGADGEPFDITVPSEEFREYILK